MTDGSRRARAWVVAPLAAIVMVWVTVCTVGLVAYRPPSLADWVRMTGAVLVISLLFGAPVAYLAELVVGVPAYRLLRARHRLVLAPVLAIGALTGALAFNLAAGLYLGVWSWGLGSLVGGVAGATSSGCFWLLGVRSPADAAPPNVERLSLRR